MAVLAAVLVTLLFEADIGRALLLSSSMVAGAPPVLYLLLAFALLRGTPIDRRIGWAVAACGVYAALGLASGVTLSIVHPMSLEGAMRRALWSYAPAPLIHLLAAPLVLLAWRSRVIPTRVTTRVERSSAPLVARVPAPPLPAATPDWDSVLHSSSPSQWASASATAVFERAGREREVAADAPARERTPAPASAPMGDVAAPPPAPTPAPPMVAAPAPMVAAPAPIVTPPAPMVAAAPPAPAAPAPSPIVAPPRPAVAKPTPVVNTPRPIISEPKPTRIVKKPVEAGPELPAANEPVIRVPFERIADQLPPDVFTLPPERLAEILHEPHVLLVPHRLVLPQLGEGAVEIAWTLVDSQFPELAFAMPQADVRRRFPGWVLSLPMDEVVRQIPADLFQPNGLAPDLSDIVDFPAPFKPGPPQPEEDAESETTAPPAPPPAAPVIARAPVTAPVAPAPPRPKRDIAPAATSSTLTPEPVPAPDVILAAVAAPPAAVPAPPAAPATHVTPPAAVPPPAPVRPPALPPAPPSPVVVPTPAPVAARPIAPAAPSERVAPPVPAPAPVPSTKTRESAVSDEDGDALARGLAVSLAPLGAFDWQARRIGGRLLVSFVPRALGRVPIDALAVSAASLVERLGGWGIEQMTIRTTRLACVLTPLGSRGCLAATVRRGGSMAMLELMSARAARVAGEITRPAAPVLGFPAVATTPIAGDNGHRRVGEAARLLGAFGPIASSLAEADGAAPSVYVFTGRDQATLAGTARVVYDELVRDHTDEALGRVESVVLRRGRAHVVVRPLLGHPGGPAVLAAAGDVALAGRAHRAIAQAATLLEAR
jgi:hypothetical protein